MLKDFDTNLTAEAIKERLEKRVAHSQELLTQYAAIDAALQKFDGKKMNKRIVADIAAALGDYDVYYLCEKGWMPDADKRLEISVRPKGGAWDSRHVHYIRGVASDGTFNMQKHLDDKIVIYENTRNMVAANSRALQTGAYNAWAEKLDKLAAINDELQADLNSYNCDYVLHTKGA